MNLASVAFISVTMAILIFIMRAMMIFKGAM